MLIPDGPPDFRRRAAPRRMGEAVAQLLARRGYARIEGSRQLGEQWRQAAGERIAAASRVGNLRRGVLEIVVGSSALLQELTFQKAVLLDRMQQAAPEPRIRDLRFRVGSTT